MPRLSLPKKSRLRNLVGDYGYGFWSESYACELLCIALIALYAPDDSDRIDLYRKHRHNMPRFLRACSDGELLPCRNKVQESFVRLCPRSTSLHLYIPVRESDKPTHYVFLVRDEESGLWRLKSPRVYELYPPKKPPRDGILAHWKTEYSPVPGDIACGLPMDFRRVLTGGQGIREMVEEIQDNYELRRQLTHCAMVCELFGGMRSGRITVRDVPGKVVFRVSEPGASGDSSTAFVTPWDFEPERINPYARKVEKPSVIVWGSAAAESLCVSQKPRSIQPQVRNAEEYVFDANQKAYQFISDILLSRLLPFVGVTDGHGMVDILGISYNPEDQRTIIAAHAVGRRASSFGMIPQFQLYTEHGLWSPNRIAVEILKAMLFEKSHRVEIGENLLLERSSDAEAYEERKYWLARVFKWLGANRPERYPEVFEFWGQPLSDTEKAMLVKWRNSRQDT